MNSEAGECIGEHHTDSVTTPGELLKNKRLALGFDTRRVATELCLSVSVIEEIERNEFGHLHGLVYVRGYLSSYARLVKLPESEIIHLFSKLKCDGVVEDSAASLVIDSKNNKSLNGLICFFKGLDAKGLALCCGLLFLIVVGVWLLVPMKGDMLSSGKVSLPSSPSVSVSDSVESTRSSSVKHLVPVAQKKGETAQLASPDGKSVPLQKSKYPMHQSAEKVVSTQSSDRVTQEPQTPAQTATHDLPSMKNKPAHSDAPHLVSSETGSSAVKPNYTVINLSKEHQG